MEGEQYDPKPQKTIWHMVTGLDRQMEIQWMEILISMTPYTICHCRHSKSRSVENLIYTRISMWRKMGNFSFWLFGWIAHINQIYSQHDFELHYLIKIHLSFLNSDCIKDLFMAATALAHSRIFAFALSSFAVCLSSLQFVPASVPGIFSTRR